LLLAVLFTLVGVVGVWQGFGVAGYGTDAHAMRVIAAVAPLFICGLVLVWPSMKFPIRVVAVLLGVGGAAAAWWFVPSNSGKWSLRDAVAERDKVKSWTATPLLDHPENGQQARASLASLEQQYPTLAGEIRADYSSWVGVAEQALVERYRKTPLDDLKTALELQSLRTAIGTQSGHAGEAPVDVAVRQWLSNAVHAKTNELSKLPQKDWEAFCDAFNKTATGRKALAEAFPQTRDTLIRAEEDWVDSTIELIVSNVLTPKPDKAPPTREEWLSVHKEVLALKSVDDGDRRFAKARQRLFMVAHQAAQRDIAARFAAGQYEVALGIATSHKVNWDATAAILGANELKLLFELRETCDYFAKLDAVAARPPEAPEVAPPPRTKSDGK
jgi:hypothetical protein